MTLEEKCREFLQSKSQPTKSLIQWLIDDLNPSLTQFVRKQMAEAFDKGQASVANENTLIYEINPYEEPQNEN